MANDKNGWIYLTGHIKACNKLSRGMEPEKSFTDCVRYDDHEPNYVKQNYIEGAQGVSCLF